MRLANGSAEMLHGGVAFAAAAVEVAVVWGRGNIEV